MKSTRDTREEERFYSLLRQHLHKNDRNNGPKEFHVSDLLSPRKWYWKEHSPKEFTKKEVGFFLGGQAHHIIAEIILAGTEGKREHQATMVTPSGTTIIGTMDAQRKVPLEFKTSRKWTIPEDPADHYIDQLLSYCVLTSSASGKVVVFYLTPGRKWDGKSATGPEVAAWNIEFTKEELESGKDHLVNTSDLCIEARENETPDILPLCDDWMCGNKYKGKVQINCSHYEECQPMGRYPESMIK